MQEGEILLRLNAGGTGDLNWIRWILGPSGSYGKPQGVRAYECTNVREHIGSHSTPLSGLPAYIRTLVLSYVRILLPLMFIPQFAFAIPHSNRTFVPSYFRTPLVFHF
jgi:hypothetical protein